MSIFEDIDKVSSEEERSGPTASVEFRRIQALPRRIWEEAGDLDALVAGLTTMLKTPQGTMTLKTIQAAALREIYDNRGLFGPIAVGAGKALITLLAAELLGIQRPLLVVPAALRDQTLQKVIPEMSQHWRLPKDLRVIGYSELSLEKNANILNRINPGMLIFDECHKLRHLKSGRTKRVNRYMNDNPYTVVVAVSGTVCSYSIMHFWHILQWVLKPMNTPLPSGYHEALQWANALDERVIPMNRTGAGVLTQFGSPEIPNRTTRARRGFRQRLVETPGVLATQEDQLGVGLQLNGIKDIEVPQAVTELMGRVEQLWETPDGDIILEAMQLKALLKQIASGFYYRWTEKPPREWMDARRAWFKKLRHILQFNRRNLDTPLQVWNDQLRKHNAPAAPSMSKKTGDVFYILSNYEADKADWERGFQQWLAALNPFHCEWCAWLHVREDFKPVTEAVWIDKYLVRYAVDWIEQGPGICWYQHRAMGEAIEQASGAPRFGAGDSTILDASGPVVTSIRAHGTGKNLQQWDRNLVMSPMPSGDGWEQLLGRTHRMGQQSDTVTCEVPVVPDIFLSSMQQAFADARFLEDTLGNRQRLLYCDTNIKRS